jgi:hypothetical protein
MHAGTPSATLHRLAHSVIEELMRLGFRYSPESPPTQPKGSTDEGYRIQLFEIQYGGAGHG